MNKWDSVELSDQSQLIGTLVRDDAGEVEIEHNDTRERETIPIPPIIGGLLLAGGVVLLLTRSRRD